MEPQILFTNKLEELTALAAAGGGVLQKSQVEQLLGDLLNEEQLSLVYQYLEQQKIRVEGWSQTTEERLAGRRRLNLRDVENRTDNGENAEQENGVSGDRDEESAVGSAGTEAQSAMAGFASLFGQGEHEDAVSEEEGSDFDEVEGDALLSVLEQYLEDLGELSEIDGTQRLELLRAAAAGDAAALSKAAESYLPMVCDLAGEYEKDAVLPVEDLIQEGNIALWTELSVLGEVTSLAAAEAQLMNAVSKHMEEVLKTEMDETDSDEAMARKVNRLHEAIRGLQEDAGRSVTVDELSAFLEMSSDEIRDILNLAGDELKMD